MFIMGSPVTEFLRSSTETQFPVTLSAFRMSKFEITNAQYADFLNSKGVGNDGTYPSYDYPKEVLIYPGTESYNWGLNFADNKWLPVIGYENHPVICVTWFGAKEFAKYMSGDLPTEAQWEYACRAGTTTPFNTGNCISDTLANYNWVDPYSFCSNTVTSALNKTQTVGTYPANLWGLHDMHGNVCEWCNDWYGTYPTTHQINPTGPESGIQHISRGGSWLNFASECRSANRLQSRIIISSSFGFRIVINP
jgi:formylglycine-generating enzyme